MTIFRTLAIAVALLGADVARAQAAPADAAAAGTGGCHVVAGTGVELELTETVSSKDRHHGDRFGLRLHSPLQVDGATILPAGTPGVGEIVHADRARGGGKPGELILAARYLQVGTMQVPLHGMKLGLTGKDNSGVSLAVSTGIGMFAFFIHGGEIEVPAGTLAQAKLLQDVDLPMQDKPSAPTAASSAPATPPISTTASSTTTQESR